MVGAPETMLEGAGRVRKPRKPAASSPGGRTQSIQPESRVSAAAGLRRAAAATGESDFSLPRGARFGGVRFRLRGGVPRSWPGRVLSGAVVLAVIGAGFAGVYEARAMLLRDHRLVIPSSAAIESVGNVHVTRGQLLSVFGEDVDSNLLTVPLEVRRAQLEQMPWVEHATVMRLLPNRVRVSIQERTPVAFVRQGNHVGLVDAHGVLLDIAPESLQADKYSFPVVTGITAEQTASVRESRMKLYGKFMSQLDSGGDKVTQRLSEVDLTSPEDVKALMTAGGAGGGGDILVHFGDQDFLERYRRFADHLPEWRSQYPKLASVDMRYERQVVLEMSPGAAVPDGAAGASAPAPAAVAKPAVAASKKPAAKAAAKPAKVIVKTPAHHLETAFAVKGKAGRAHGKPGGAR